MRSRFVAAFAGALLVAGLIAGPVTTPIAGAQVPPGDIIVFPNSGLIHGQAVDLSATGWPTTAASPGRMLFVTQCAIGDGGSDASCDPTTLKSYELNPDGSLPTPAKFTVKQTLAINWPSAGTSWNCTTSPCGLRGAVYAGDTEVASPGWEAMELPGQNTVNFGPPPSQPSLQVFPPNGIFGSSGWPNGKTVTVTIDDPGTTSSPDYTGTSSIVGQPCPPGPCGSGQFGLITDPYVMKAGDAVLAAVSDAPAITASHVVQPLAITNVDLANNKVGGTARRGSSPMVSIGNSPVTRTPIANGGTDPMIGDWTADFSPYDLTQYDTIIATAGQGQGSTVAVVQGAPRPPPELTPTPDTELVNGQVITLTGSNWPAGKTLSVGECLLGSPDPLPQICDGSPLQTYVIAADGSLPTGSTFVVEREISISSSPSPFDCGARTATCGLVAVAWQGAPNASNAIAVDYPYRNAINFKGALPGPTITGTVLGDGGAVVPNTGVTACPGDTWVLGCNFGQGSSVDATGNFRFGVHWDPQVWTVAGTSFGPGNIPSAQLTEPVILTMAPGETYSCAFTIGATPSATCSIGDSDGILGSVEDRVNAAGDGNGDGTRDSLQANVVSLPSQVTGNPYVTIASPSGTTLSDVSTLPVPTTPALPDGAVFPVGLVSFKVHVATEGATAPVKVFLPAGSGVNAYYKLDVDKWVPFAGASITGDVVTLTLTDGVAPGDQDGLANSLITEPGAPAVVTTPPFDFEGFFAPVNNPPVRNSVKAGKAIPVKFSLGGNQGMDILAEGYPKSRSVDCNSEAPTDEIETTIETPGASQLTYDAKSDRYQLVWKTDKAWRGCRQLTLLLSDGTTHRAIFEFK